MQIKSTFGHILSTNGITMKKGDDHPEAMITPTLEEEAKRTPERQQTTASRKTPNTPETGDESPKTKKGEKDKP